MRISIESMDLGAVQVEAKVELDGDQGIFLARWDGHDEDETDLDIYEVDGPEIVELEQDERELIAEYLEDRYWFAQRVAGAAFEACVVSLKRDGGREV